METKKLCCGIDVSHTTLDVCYQNNLGDFFHLKVGNNITGFKKIIEHTGNQYHFVMEATGVYYIRLAFYLNEVGCVQSVVNALAIKRYIQMHLERNKSDKKDAMWICKFAIDQNPPYWQMPDSAYFESKQLYNTIREYTEQIKRFNNQLHSLRLLPIPSKDTIASLEKIKKQLKSEIKKLEEKLEMLLKKWQPEQLKNISSIKGIGKRASAMLIVFTQGFKHTHNHRQLISFAGLSPTEYSSGTSIQGKPRIYKKGGKNLRDVLYMCSMNAIKTNAKLLKQVYAVVKNGTMYQPNYCSARP